MAPLHDELDEIEEEMRRDELSSSFDDGVPERPATTEDDVPRKVTNEKPISLHPLTVDEALSAAMKVPLTKKAEPAAKEPPEEVSAKVDDRDEELALLNKDYELLQAEADATLEQCTKLKTLVALIPTANQLSLAIEQLDVTVGELRGQIAAHESEITGWHKEIRELEEAQLALTDLELEVNFDEAVESAEKDDAARADADHRA